MASLQPEIERRAGATQAMLTLLEATPWTWIGWREFAVFAPCSWRTRLSNARKQVRKSGGEIRWNQSVTHSAYRLEHQRPLGRPADVPTVQPELIPVRY